MKRIATILLSCIMIASSVISIAPISAFAAQAVEVLDSSNSLVQQFDIDMSGNITTALNKAFAYTMSYANLNNRLTVKVPSGNYYITKCTTLSSYTTLDLTDNVVISNACSGSGNIFMSPKDTMDYNGLIDFQMLGGTLTYAEDNYNGSCLMRFAHCSNISINNTSFTNGYYSHFVELAACQNFTFDSCVFDKFDGSTGSSSCEAIQIDILEPNSHFSGMPAYDGTMNSNIVVQNCTFNDLVRGIGTRSLFQGYYQDNITIRNNTFSNLSSTAITCTAYVDCDIYDNTITNCGEGISFYMMRNDSGLKGVCTFDYDGEINTDCRSNIYNNSIDIVATSETSTPSGILVYGNNVTSAKKSKYSTKTVVGDYSVQKINIHDNSITASTGNGIRLYDTKNSSVTNNVVTSTSKKGYGIYLANTSANNVISANTCNGFSNGVIVCSSSASNTIKYNKVNNSGDSGIVTNSGTTKQFIYGNTINNAGKHGILVAGNCTSVQNNNITASKQYGICCNASSSVGSISGNNFNNSITYPIYCADTAAVAVLNNNYKSGVDKVYVVGDKKKYSFKNLAKPAITVTKSGTTATIKWNKVSYTSKYYVYRATSKKGTYKLVGTASASKRSYKDKKLKKGKTYYYKIRAIKKAGKVTGYSDYSAVKGKKI